MKALSRHSVSRMIFFTAGLMAGLKPLADPDLGWHLAGGLWIVNSGGVPREDFLAAGAHPWVSYSWLFEVLIGLVFNAGGFHALLLLQAFLVALCWLVVVWAMQVFSSENEVSPRLLLLNLILTAAALIFAAPIFQLRPQLLSFIFSVLEVTLLALGTLSLPEIFVLTILWANIHVFWIFSPLFYLLFAPGESRSGRRVMGAALLGTAGLVSPYGFANLGVLLSYAFEHQAGYALVSEFEPLSPKQGMVFLLFVALSAVAAFWGRKMVYGHGSRPVLLYLLFAAASFKQIKYLPLAGFFLAVGLLRAANNSMTLCRERLSATEGIGCVFVFSLLALFYGGSDLDPRYTELLTASSVAARETPSGVVLNHFNYGGWTGLGLYLAKPESADRSPLRTWIDGRTLVMGERRLQEFERFRRGDPCLLLSSFSAVIAGRPEGFSARLEQCLGGCRVVFRGRYWRTYASSGFDGCPLHAPPSSGEMKQR